MVMHLDRHHLSDNPVLETDIVWLDCLVDHLRISARQNEIRETVRT